MFASGDTAAAVGPTVGAGMVERRLFTLQQTTITITVENWCDIPLTTSSCNGLIETQTTDHKRLL